MGNDQIEELVNIEISRLQRWALIAAAAGEHEFANEAVAELCHREAMADARDLIADETHLERLAA